MSNQSELDVIIKKTEQVALYRVSKIIAKMEKDGKSSQEIMDFIKQHLDTATE
jgi:hypothetical protein